MMKRAAVSAIVGALLTAIGTCGPTWAGEPGASWGVVDMDKVALDYRGMHELERQFQQFQQQQDEVWQTHYKTRVLYDDERQEFLDLAHMGAPTEENDTRLAELARLSDTRERRLLELRQSKERTPGEEQEYQQLKVLYDQRLAELTSLQAEFQQAREAKREELNGVLTESVNTAVKAVAEERGLVIVVRKEIVLFGGTDITTEVVDRLNAAEPTEAAEEASEG